MSSRPSDRARCSPPKRKRATTRAAAAPACARWSACDAHPGRGADPDEPAPGARARPPPLARAVALARLGGAPRGAGARLRRAADGLPARLEEVRAAAEGRAGEE